MKVMWDACAIGIGSMLVAASFNLLLVPHQLLSGGVSGIAMMAGYMTGWNIGIVYFAANLPILVWGLLVIGRRFIVLSVLSVIMTTWLMQVIPVRGLTSDPILGSVFGGVLLGIGSGLSLRVGGSTGGFDIVASILTRNRDLPLGMLLFALNSFVVVALGYYKENWDLALYSMLSIYISGRVMDTIHVRHFKLSAFIVTRHKEKLLDPLLSLPRGVTIVQAEGGYSQSGQVMLMTVITRYELTELKRIVQRADPKAFVNIVETVGVLGEFRRQK